MLLCPAADLDDVALVKRALLLAAAYALHCKHRRLGLLGPPETYRAALRQAVREAARGHAGATNILTGIWSRSSQAASSTPLPSTSSGACP